MAAADSGRPDQASGSRLTRDLARITDLDREGLLHWYQQLHGSAAPQRLSRPILELAIAYHLQEQYFGKLRAGTRKTLMAGEPAPVPANAGTLLVREWQGVHHSVQILHDGVAYAGKHYRSLTEVAKAITGLHRSGPSFFGLKKRKTNPSKPATSRRAVS